MDEKLPVINLELNSGVFRIKTREAIYQISVTTESSLTRVVEKIVEKEVVRPEVTSQKTADPFYQEISEELYGEIGKLARQLSLSIKELPKPNLKGLSLEQTGIELEDAKGQLEDIVQMTEKATMDIMDLADAIQEDLKKIQSHLTLIKELEFMANSDEGLNWGEPQDSSQEMKEEGWPARQAALTEFLGNLLESETRLRDKIHQLPTLSPEAPVEPGVVAQPATPAKKVTTYTFDIDVVFQTLYELCTNEAVKEHIKAMRADQEKAFNIPAVHKTLVDLVPTVEVEDNFFNFPITGILKGLFVATNNEKYKQVLKKMNQTTGSIFLDAVLPIMGETEEKDIPAPSESAPPKPAKLRPAAMPGLEPERITDLTGLIDEIIKNIEEEKGSLSSAVDEDQSSLGPASDFDPNYSKVKNEDRAQIISSVEGTDKMVQKVMSHLTRILESLSFQDLSGQRILKIVRLIGNVQVQLLSLLVAYGTKIKKKQEVKTVISPKDTDKLAQAEVDKMLERIGTPPSDLAGPEATGRLDQEAVDDLLKDLGF